MNEHKVYLVAAGGHARVLLDSLFALQIKVDGIIDAQSTQSILNVPVIGNDEWLLQQKPESIRLVNGLGIVGNNLAKRQMLYNTCTEKGFSFLSVKHPTAITSTLITVHLGVQLMAGVQVQCGTLIGDNVVLNTGATVDHDCSIGAHSFIGPGSVLCGHVWIGKQVLIGAGAVILPGITIGEGAIVGAGSLVTKDVSAYTCVFGNPAKFQKLL
jgi:sugar O-acyltransferase (sialic acid O-acetyltransferase NeuD family)